MPPTVRDVNEADFADVVIEGSKTRPVVVDFWAAWCGPCRQLSPLLEQMAERFEGDVDVVKVDVDANPRLAQQFRVQGIPAVKAFSGGRLVSEFVGLQPPQAVEAFFAALAPSPADRLAQQALTTADDAEREQLFRQALDAQVDHPVAAIGLARLHADRGEVEEALAVLAKARPTDEVKRMIAELHLASSGGDLEDLRAAAASGDVEARLELGRALAATGAHDEAVEVLLEAVREPDTREPAREALLEIFTVLGNDHPLVRAARPRLAAALF